MRAIRKTVTENFRWKNHAYVIQHPHRQICRAIICRKWKRTLPKDGQIAQIHSLDLEY